MKKLLPIIAAVVVVGGAGFYGGMAYGKGSAAPSAASVGAQAFGQGGNFSRRNGQAGGFVSGQIVGKDDKSITVGTADGGSKIVFVSGSTRVMKSSLGALTDLAIGESVTANGTANSDGSVTAQSVQLRPATVQGSGPSQGQ